MRTKSIAECMFPDLPSQAAGKQTKVKSGLIGKSWWETGEPRWDAPQPPIKADYSRIPGLRRKRTGE